ncbi:methyl-accepting chemotaxis protein [Mangrovihabitans endophyticus]|uniref:Methyl-accepting transducer domain-containing protein n=1 Tax=Mangrovihabitans endophyticus TaxID=1751298 RepID=A0A8J3C419_9ACTN|nr:methyl-accepting chemotaxis protein [Mangrovihabitans endophyticus]GGL07472.1 hypothetical protein GCM10012284_47230 [Mangrovihabitans endophyticus]
MSAVWVVSALLLGAAVGFLLGRRRPATHPETADASGADPFVVSVGKLGSEVGPVWSAHVESSRSQMEEAIGSLIARFAGIVQLLDQALTSSRAGGGKGEMDVFLTSRNRLGEVVESLEQSLAKRRQAVQEMRDLLGRNEELHAMTEEVSRIAAQTHLLALNAGIEAARVGEAGRAFNVVASEIRQLAESSGSTSERIGQKASEVGDAISAVCTAAEQDAEAEIAAVADANGKVSQVLDELRALVDRITGSSAELGGAAEGIKSQIEESLVQFQFQDRLSQTLEHLRDSIDRTSQELSQTPGGVPRPVDTTRILHELTSSYTMVEEQATHRSGAPVSVASSDITFF